VKVGRNGTKWGAVVDRTFRGTYDHTIDEKGRLSFPSKFRETLRLYESETLVVLPWWGEHLRVYPFSEWENFQEKLTADIDDAPKNRVNIIRYIMSHSNDCSLDKQGRILIPPHIRSQVDLNKDIVLLGVKDRVEIWDRARWTDVCNSDVLNAEVVQESLEKLKIF
jgi:MraZ protein